MKNRNSLSTTEPELSEINISPMIDMVFILLIFFIVTTVFVEEPGVEINKPPAIMAKDLEKNSILIAVTSTNQIIYGGREVGVAGIRPIVKRLNQKGDNMPVILQVDESSSAGLVVRAIDEAKLGGAEKVSISTEL